MCFLRQMGALTENFSIFLLLLPDLFRGMEAWWKTMEPQNLGNSPGPGSEVIERQNVAKERAAQSP